MTSLKTRKKRTKNSHAQPADNVNNDEKDREVNRATQQIKRKRGRPRLNATQQVVQQDEPKVTQVDNEDENQTQRPDEDAESDSDCDKTVEHSTRQVKRSKT
jgi:hypothetical protein